MRTVLFQASTVYCASRAFRFRIGRNRSAVGGIVAMGASVWKDRLLNPLRDRSIPKTAISFLRRRMIEDMTVRNLSPATQRSYLNAVSKFARFFGRSPDTLMLEDVRSFQIHWHRSAWRRRA